MDDIEGKIIAGVVILIVCLTACGFISWGAEGSMKDAPPFWILAGVILFILLAVLGFMNAGAMREAVQSADQAKQELQAIELQPEQQTTLEKQPDGSTKIGGGATVCIFALILAIYFFSKGLWYLAIPVLGGGAWWGIWLIKEGNWEKNFRNQAKRLIAEHKPLKIRVPEQSSMTSGDPESEQVAETTDLTSFQSGLTVLGRSPDDTTRNLSMPTRDRYAGMYVIGVQGVGKSSFLEDLIYQEITGDQAVIVIDPHGDLIDHCIAQMPERRLADAFLLDIEDIEYPFGLNLFAIKPDASVTDQAGAQDRILHVFEKCFPDTSRMLLEKYLGNIAPVFFANASAGHAMTDIPKFLRDDDFRAKLLRSSKVRYAIREYWQDDYGSLSPSKRQTETASLSTRLNRFVRSPIVGNIIGQSTTTIDFRKAIEDRKIIFIKLPVKTLKEDAQLIGTMLIAQIHAAIFSFADIPLERRPGFSLFVDEFQHFATSDFSEMFTEGRKFGARVTVAHQYRDQLPEYLQKASQTARTKVCFQTTGEDSRELATYYQNIVKPTFDRSSIDPYPIDYLLEHGSYNTDVTYFLDNYIRPTKATSEQVTSSSYTIDPTMRRIEVATNRDNKQKAKDQIDILNRFVFEAEVAGDYRRPLTREIIDYCLEKATSGSYSLHATDHIRRYAGAVDHNNGYTLFADPALFDSPETVNQAREKMLAARLQTDQPLTAYRDLQSVDNAFFVLDNFRLFLYAIVQELIGRAKPVSNADIASMIVGLPRRYAFVRTGSKVFQLYTSDTPPTCSKAEQEKRLQTIKNQTRATYCKPASQVDQQISKRLGLTTTLEREPVPEVEREPVPDQKPPTPETKQNGKKTEQKINLQLFDEG
jgi:GTPase SAR1 family protein